MKTIDIKMGATSLEEVVRLVEQEAEIVLTDGPKPVAKVVSIAARKGDQAMPLAPRKLGLHPGAMEASEDFDEPLPDEFWLGKANGFARAGW